MARTTVSIEFDGVLHECGGDPSISWWPAVTTGKPVPGAMEWLVSLIDDERFDVEVIGARGDTSAGHLAMSWWFDRHMWTYLTGVNIRIAAAQAWMKRVRFPREKPEGAAVLHYKASQRHPDHFANHHEGSAFPPLDILAEHKLVIVAAETDDPFQK